MSDQLSTEQRFEDRLEIVGYGTAGLSSLLLLIYFGMLLFSPAAQNQPLATKGGRLIILLSLSSIGFFIPYYKNFARLFYRLFFTGLTLFSYFKVVNQNSLWYLLLLGYTLYANWILVHPQSIRLFRPLTKQEDILVKHSASWYIFHRSLFALFIMVIVLKGLQAIWTDSSHALYSPENGMALLIAAFLSLFILIGLRRFNSVARWSAVSVGLIVVLLYLPQTMAGQADNYLDYWRALLHAFYFLGFSAYLSFAPIVKTLYSTPTPTKG